MVRFPVSLGDIRRATDALRGVMTRKPMLEIPDVNAMLGGRLLLKAENLQRTSAFKICSANHRMPGLTDEKLSQGPVTYLSGNHVLGLARAARLLELSAVIVLPSDVPAAKMAAVHAMGAAIVTCHRDRQDSADVAAQVMAETGRIEVHRAHIRRLWHRPEPRRLNCSKTRLSGPMLFWCRAMVAVFRRRPS